MRPEDREATCALMLTTTFYTAVTSCFRAIKFSFFCEVLPMKMYAYLIACMRLFVLSRLVTLKIVLVHATKAYEAVEVNLDAF